MKRPSELSKQCLEIYLLFKYRRGKGVTPEDITDRDRLNIKEYTGRITDLRKAGYGIQNVRKNLYVLISEPQMSKKDVLFIKHEAEVRSYFQLVKRCQDKLAKDEAEQVLSYLS